MKKVHIKFQHIPPLPHLKGYIEKVWVFESSEPMPEEDMKLVAPNGRLLLVIPFRNGIAGRMDDKDHLVKTNRIALVGMSDRSSIVDAETNGPIGTIGVEISPMGAYRILPIRLKSIKNQLNYLSDILGKTARDFEQRLAETESIDDKILHLQEFLLSLFLQTKEDALFDYCLHQIETSKGSLHIGKLEQKTGYTSRWLNMKFEERIGVSPKNLSSIIRFQQYYQALLSNSVDFFRQKNFYYDYHDESHFIKEFKRFTGLPPAKLMRSQNEFGKTFYQD